jgi:hypothetical protein
LVVVGGFLGGMALCQLWTCDSLVQFRRKWLAAAFRGLEITIMPLLMVARVTKHPYVLWPILIPPSVFYCVYFWRLLGDSGSAKSAHRALILQKTEGRKQVVVQVSSHRYVAQMRSRRRVEEWFLGRIRKADLQAVWRPAWGWLYRTFGPILPYWQWIGLPLLVGVVVQGYVSRFLVELSFWAFATLAAANVLPDTSSMLLPEGRRQRYHLTIVAAGVTTLLLITVSVAVVALSWVLAALLPPISWGTHHWQYAGVPIGSLWLTCVSVPWVFLSGPIWHRVLIVRGAITIVVAFLAIGEIFARNEGLYHGPTLPPILLIGGWALLPLALWVTYRRWDLVEQQPRRED